MMWWTGLSVVFAGVGIVGWAVIGSPQATDVEVAVLLVAGGYLAVSSGLIVVGLRAAGRVTR